MPLRVPVFPQQIQRARSVSPLGVIESAIHHGVGSPFTSLALDDARPAECPTFCPLDSARTSPASRIAHWESTPRHPDPVFAHDGWRCTVPACSSRRSLHDHHIRFQSRGGDNRRDNRTTVCAAHHLHGLHDGTVARTGSRRMRSNGSSAPARRPALPHLRPRPPLPTRRHQRDRPVPTARELVR
jgi:hypothetical protein